MTGEIELASRYLERPLVAVTGTNGKSTVTELIGAMLSTGGRKVFVGGNIGRPLIDFVRRGAPAELVVVELSSFQLETVDRFHPRVAVLLNVTPDHLDRYSGLEEYRRAKLRIFTNQDATDFAVLNADDPLCRPVELQARRRFFSRRERLGEGACLVDGRIVLVEEDRIAAEFDPEELSLIGSHNQENVMAALLAARALDIPADRAWSAAAAFQGLPHRIEMVGASDGVVYYDDSKGTNVGAVVKSLESFTEPVILIAGGRAKDSDFSALKAPIRRTVRLLILIGEARHEMAENLKHETETVLVEDMARAVKLARDRARPGDRVLLSPACASFDQFENYRHRGEVFSELVREAIR